MPQSDRKNVLPFTLVRNKTAIVVKKQWLCKDE